MIDKRIIITAKDGFKLGAHIREPETDFRGLVQINSGTGIPQEFYKNFAKYLTNLGYVTITYDYRGIGKSKPKNLKGFNATNSQWGSMDMSAILDWSINEYPALEKIVIGHSMGGQLIGLMENNNKIDRVFLIASGTGYWKDMPEGKIKWLMPFLWYFYMPLNIFVFGFSNAKKIKQGENLPKGVALQWRKWCLNKSYWDSEFGKTIDKYSFSKLSAPIQSLVFTDDNLVSRNSNKKLLAYFNQTRISEIEISPKSVGLNKIGHFGYFSRSSEKLWANLL